MHTHLVLKADRPQVVCRKEDLIRLHVWGLKQPDAQSPCCWGRGELLQPDIGRALQPAIARGSRHFRRHGSPPGCTSSAWAWAGRWPLAPMFA